jgi:hypothetical protein
MRVFFCWVFFLYLSAFTAQNNGIKTIKVKKTQTDTVDFLSFPFYEYNNYVLTKIVQGKGVTVRQLNGSPFHISISLDSAGNYTKVLGIKVNYGDTIFTNQWDSNDQDVARIVVAHSTGVLHLNKKSNTLVVNSMTYSKKGGKRILYTKVFKVLKWTFFGVILRDITNPEFNRTFYFQRKTECF